MPPFQNHRSALIPPYIIGDTVHCAHQKLSLHFHTAPGDMLINGDLLWINTVSDAPILMPSPAFSNFYPYTSKIVCVELAVAVALDHGGRWTLLSYDFIWLNLIIWIQSNFVFIFYHVYDGYRVPPIHSHSLMDVILHVTRQQTAPCWPTDVPLTAAM